VRPRIAQAPLLSTWLLCCAFSADTSAAPVFNLSEPAPGVFVHVGQQLALDVPGHDDIANIGFIVGRRCVAVIDTGGSVHIGRALYAAIVKQTKTPVCFVINTHDHVDHVLGNLAFASAKPSFVGSSRLREALARDRDFFVKQYGSDLDSPPTVGQIIAPDRLVQSELELDLGGRILKLRAWPKAHTNCDLTVLDVQTRTLWTGDLLFRQRLPALDGSVKGWLSAIAELAQTPAALVVPGHGPATHDLALALTPERTYLQALEDGVRGEIAAGKPMDDAIAHVGLMEKSQWILWENVHPHNVARAFEELEWE
jgi:quinoprotein relay system zinc metallohydrolase 2